MNKLWKSREYRSDPIILIYEKTIFKGKLEEELSNPLTVETITPEITNKLFSIPYSYIRKIVNQEGIDHIKVFFGNNSEEELRIPNKSRKDEIFNFLKEDMNGFRYEKTIPHSVSYLKPQLFMMLFLTVAFLWSLHYAIELAQGTQYELNGSPGIDGLMLSIGSLGIPKVIIIFGVLLGLVIFSALRKLKTRSTMHILIR